MSTVAEPYELPTLPSPEANYGFDKRNTRELVDFRDDLPRSEKYQIIQDQIGFTPVEQIEVAPGVSVLTKHEWDNLSGSHYDRALLPTLFYLESHGYIAPGDEIRDITSGSCGISLALLGNLLGYSIRVTVPEELPLSRVAPMIRYGADVVSAGAGYVPAAASFQATEIEEFRSNPNWENVRPPKDMASSFIFSNGERRVCFLNHSENPLSPESFRAIGTELVSQLVERPDAVFLAAGNWTTIAGISPVIRAAWPDTQIIAYEGEHTDQAHTNFGTSVDGVRLKYKDETLVDDLVSVSDADRDAMYDVVNPERTYERAFGHSSLMGLVAAQQRMESGLAGRAVTLVYDSHVRY